MTNVLKQQAEAVKQAGYLLATKTGAERAAIVKAIASALERAEELILEANQRDVVRAEQAGTSASLIDRLSLDSSRVATLAEGVRQVAELPDPLAVESQPWSPREGLTIRKVRVPLGAAAIIYEARPNVTVDAAVLCLYSGNSVLLRGSSSAQESNKALVEVLQAVLVEHGLPSETISLVENPVREELIEVLKLRGVLDVVIPRGGAGLIEYVVTNSLVPVIETGAGICHVYLDKTAQTSYAREISLNAKVQRPSVCNACETILIHKEWSVEGVVAVFKDLVEHGVELRLDDELAVLAESHEIPYQGATEADWSTEYLDLVVSCKQVSSLEEAIEHIHRYGTAHSECIITETQEVADKFLQTVDAAAVYHNASTRFTDGFEFGFGAEIGISNQKLHARGPMGLPELTSYKYVIEGGGTTR